MKYKIIPVETLMGVRYTVKEKRKFCGVSYWSHIAEYNESVGDDTTKWFETEEQAKYYMEHGKDMPREDEVVEKNYYTIDLEHLTGKEIESYISEYRAFLSKEGIEDDTDVKSIKTIVNYVKMFL